MTDNVNTARAGELESLVGRLADEFLARQERGERPDVEEYAARHPEAAELIRRALGSLRLVESVGNDPGPTDLASDSTISGVLGDFRIVREIGRGGMGVVYEAEQVSLRRRVALKVLPFAAVIDPRSMQRFKSEALAAAGLDHPNVVKVHAVGCDRGVHYIAMQFVDGRTLADLIAERRPEPAGAGESDPAVGHGAAPHAAETQPAAKAPTERVRPDAGFYRRVAEWAAQAADALEHAHGLGVVHRDVKPANLLVDGRGHLWVTDFGLALVATDPALTASGDLIGTPRYMSPEQARAKHGLVDHRTDIYALGATFYELLTCESAVVGRDREDVLRNIASADPVPLRKHDRHIPADLETVVLKCLEKDADRRYQSARELADDIRRILEDKPIRAKPPTLWQRTAKWARRHKPVAAGLAVALLATVVLAVGVGFWQQRRQAETERAVTAALTQAETLVDEGEKQIDNPERWQATSQLALAAVEKAQGLFRIGSGAEELSERVRQVRAAAEAADADSRLLIEIDRIRLEAAAAIKDGIYDGTTARRLYATLFSRYGVDLTRPGAAAEQVWGSRLHNQLVAALEHWIRLKPDVAERLQLSAVLDALEPLDGLHERWVAALRRKDAAALVQLASDPQIQQWPASDICLLAQDLHEVKEWVAAEQLLRPAQQRKPGDFWINHNLGMVLRMQGRSRADEAVGYLRVALALRSDSPGVYLNLGNALRDKGDLDDAIRCYQTALGIDQDYAIAHGALGYALFGKKDFDGALRECRAALRIDPKCAMAHNCLGLAFRAKGQLDQAIANYREALQLVKDYPEAQNNLGFALKAKGLLEEAIAEYRKAISIKKDYVLAHFNLGAALMENRQLEEAINEFREVIRLKNDDAMAHYYLGRALNQMRRHDEAIAAYYEAIRYKPDLVEAHGSLGIALGMKGRLDESIAASNAAIRLKPNSAESHQNLGYALELKGQLDKAVEAFNEAVRLKPGYADAHIALGRVKRLIELDTLLAKVLSGERQPANASERAKLANLCGKHYKQLTATAARFYGAAFAAEPKLAEDLKSQHRYDAARVAALAGCGQGADAKSLDEMERAGLRRQAQDWLRADLAAWSKQLDETGPIAAPLARQTMQYWSAEPDFAGVRGADALTKLPEAERQDWQKLWGEVADTLARAEGKAVPAKKSESK
jgi:serine/threonine protein kinase/Flp pilus assembly protein TadD